MTCIVQQKVREAAYGNKDEERFKAVLEREYNRYYLK